MEEKDTRIPFSEEEFTDLDLALRRSSELRILVRFLMKRDDFNLMWLRQALINIGMVCTRHAHEICSASFYELNQ